MIDIKDLTGVGEYVYYRDVKEDIYDFLAGKKQLITAETTNFGQYDEHFKWLRTEVTGITGIPNHGKSIYTIFLTALKMYYDNWKVAIYSPETVPAIFFFAQFIHTLTGYNLFKSGHITPDKVRSFDRLLENNLYLCDPEKMPTFTGIIERFRRAYEVHGVDMFVIDPFNCLEREWETSKRDDRYVGDFLEHYKDFVKNTNTVGVVVMHPNSGVRTKKDGMDYDVPNVYNLAGGAMWANKLDNLLIVHRPEFVSNNKSVSVLIRHAKIKKREIVGDGGDVDLAFNYITNRYSYNGYSPDFKSKDDVIKYVPKADNDLPF